MEPSPEPRETTSRCEKLLAALVTGASRHRRQGLGAPSDGGPRAVPGSQQLATPHAASRDGSQSGGGAKMRPLVTSRVDFAVVGGLAVIFGRLDSASVRMPHLAPADLIFLKQDSWREKDKLDVLALREILAREGSR